MIEMDSCIIESLYLLKQLYDNGMADGLLKMYGSTELDADYYYEMAYEAIGAVFSDCCNYYNEEAEFTTWVFMDPMLDEFCRLCQKYEQSRGVSEEDNPFRKDMERIIRSGFSFSNGSYDFDWRLSPTDRGRKRILLYMGPEFTSDSEVPCGLIEIHDGLEYCNRHLQEALDAGPVVNLPQPAVERKEAA